MSNRKRGFVFYFDNILAVESLPPDQRGWLLSALCAYADRVWQDTSVGIEEVLDLYPQLSQQASVACRFLAAGVLRDTQKWLAQQELRTRRREQQGRAPLAARPASSPVIFCSFIIALQSYTKVLHGIACLLQSSST